MADNRFDVLTIGNAIVDVIAPVEPGFLEREGLSEGIMHLVDAERSVYLYDRMPPEKRMISGGSSANTAAGVANLGGRAAFVGKVAEDDLGAIFRVHGGECPKAGLGDRFGHCSRLPHVCGGRTARREHAHARLVAAGRRCRLGQNAEALEHDEERAGEG